MTNEERAICTAPKGMHRVVNIDPRDHWPTKVADFANLDEVRAYFNKTTSLVTICMSVFDDQGNKVELVSEAA